MNDQPQQPNKESNTQICSNCGNSNVEIFCAACGQEVMTGRLTVKRLVMDWLSAFYNYSGGIIFTIRALALTPGPAVREYISGKTRKYWNPFNYFVITLTVYMLIGIRSGALSSASSYESFTNDNAAYLIMLSIPFVAAASFLLFRRSGCNFAENLTLNIFIQAQLNIYNTILFVLYAVLTSRQTSLAAIFIGFLYEIFAYKTFFRQNLFLTILKLILINIVKVIVLVIILVISYFIAK